VDDRVAAAWQQLPLYLGEHIVLSAAAIGLGLTLSMLFAIAAVRNRYVRWPVLTLASLIQTIPGLALLALVYPLLLSREAARAMGPGRRIINISSGMVVSPAPGVSVYAATKAALNSLTASHAADLGPRGITVNAVAPGTTDTEMLRAGNSDETLEKLVAMTPLGRLGLPEDVADVVVFLASEEARWITGQVIAASGGLR
jgi:3-oxoacyl-[acyl-carrier protein] reductase